MTTATWYIVHKKNTEPLISGPTAEKLGIIKFHSHISPDEAKFQRIVNDTGSSEEKIFWLKKYPLG